MTEVLIWAVAIVGSCAAVGRAVEPIVKLTKTKKDDTILAKFNTVIEFILKIINKIGLNK